MWILDGWLRLITVDLEGENGVGSCIQVRSYKYQGSYGREVKETAYLGNR